MPGRGVWVLGAVALLLVAAAGCESGDGAAADTGGAVRDSGSGAPDTGGGAPDAPGGPPDTGGAKDSAAGGPDTGAGGPDTGAGGPDTGAGGPDTGAADVPPGAWEPSAELARVLGELEKARDGQPADLDGDGAADFERAEAGGTVTYRFDGDEDGTDEVELAVAADGSFTSASDVDGDGAPERQETYTAGDAPRKMVVEDTDGNGAMDRRTTLDYGYAAGTLTYTVEADPEEDGTWAQVEVVHDRLTRDAGGGCEGSYGMPDLDDGTVQEFPGRHISIATGPGAGRCDATWAPKVAAAVDCAINRAVICLGASHPEYAAKLAAALDGEKVKDLAIGCGNTCTGTFASTRSFTRPWFGDSTMNVNPTEFGKLDAWGQCGLMLHELIHWSGDEGPPEHNDDTAGGDDAIYSCGRYCGKCGDWGKNPPNNSSVDCARCSQGTDRKLACGAKEQWTTYGCSGESYSVCHAGLACPLKQCEECGGLEKQTCDDRSTGERVYSCCMTCPSDCNASNDDPCQGAQQGTDNCTESSPPFCH